MHDRKPGLLVRHHNLHKAQVKWHELETMSSRPARFVSVLCIISGSLHSKQCWLMPPALVFGVDVHRSKQDKGTYKEGRVSEMLGMCCWQLRPKRHSGNAWSSPDLVSTEQSSFLFNYPADEAC